MASTKTYSEKVNTEKKVIGLEFQYYFFLYRVLQLRIDQTVGLEVADDVHTELGDDFQILFQLKHSLKRQVDGTPVALTPLDRDLWKTMANWSKIISDPIAGRGSEQTQVEFVNRTDFVLTTNKSRSADPTIQEMLSDPSEARVHLELLRNSSESETTKGFIDDVLNLSNPVLTRYIEKVRLDLEVDRIIEKCKTRLLEMHIPHQRIEQLFRDLDSQIRQDNFLTIKAGRKVQISFSDFSRKYRAYFDAARSVQLQIRREYTPLPTSLSSQIFIQQLVDVGDFNSNDVEQMAKLTTIKKHCERNLLRWELEGDITQLELDEFDIDSTTYWENSHRSCHRDTETPEEQRALQIIDKLRELSLTVRNQQLGIEFSNGQFYRLADVPLIGFRENWQSLFASQRD